MIVLITRGPFRYAMSLTRSPLSLFRLCVYAVRLHIRSVQCDNRHEFDSSSSRTFLLSHGVQLWMSCPYTSPQNGKAERMIRTTNNVMRSLLFQTSFQLGTGLRAFTLPPTFSTSSPPRLSQPPPPTSLFSGPLPPTPTYGSSDAPATRTPLPPLPISPPLVLAGVFLEYSEHKGYRCLDLTMNRLLLSRHVVFDPSPSSPPAHLPTTWTPSSRPVLQFARLLHPNPLLLQVLRRLSLCHARHRRPNPRNTRPRRPSPCLRPRHARPRLHASLNPLVYQR
jgi:hypothetical protein